MRHGLPRWCNTFFAVSTRPSTLCNSFFGLCETPFHVGATPFLLWILGGAGVEGNDDASTVATVVVAIILVGAVMLLACFTFLCLWKRRRHDKQDDGVGIMGPTIRSPIRKSRQVITEVVVVCVLRGSKVERVARRREEGEGGEHDVGEDSRGGRAASRKTMGGWGGGRGGKGKGGRLFLLALCSTCCTSFCPIFCLRPRRRVKRVGSGWCLRW